MKALAVSVAFAAATATPAGAQAMPGMQMGPGAMHHAMPPSTPPHTPAPHRRHGPPHARPSAPVQHGAPADAQQKAPTGEAMMDHGAMNDHAIAGMTMEAPVGTEPPPAAPMDQAADTVFDPVTM